MIIIFKMNQFYELIILLAWKIVWLVYGVK